MAQSYETGFTVDRTQDEYIVFYFNGGEINDCMVKDMPKRLPFLRNKTWFTPEMEEKVLDLCINGNKVD